MALDINGYNAQFNQFVQFAEHQMQAGKSKAVARVGDAQVGPLAGRTITAAKGEFVGNIWRSVDTRNANDIARDLFRNAIAELFHGESNIPMSVLDAMKLNDFGNGKPLTARRILAVKTAVEQATAKLNDCIAASKAGFEYTKEGVEMGDRMIETAFAACNGNADAMDIVKANIFKLTVNTQSSYRTEEDVQNKVGRLLDNLGELKEVSKGNPSIYALGKKMLAETGTALPKGMIAKLVQSAKSAPLGGLWKLSKSSSGMDIHGTLMQLQKSVKAALAFSGAQNLEGAEESVGARDFAAAAILSRCGKGALANIRGALDSQNASALNEYYSLTDAGRNGFVENASADLQAGIKDAGSSCMYALEMFDLAVNDNLRLQNPGMGEESRVKAFEGEFDIDDIGGDELIDATVSLAKDINAANVEACVDATVEGGGKGAEAMKNILRTKLDGANNPAGKLGKRLDANANAMMNWNICGEMKKLAAGDGGQFAKDIYRGTNATLTDGKTTIKLTGNFETARNELAQFVTGDPKATYGALKNDADRNKVHLLMALISQETEKAGEDGISHSLDKREANGSFLLTGFKETEKQARRTYTVQKLDDGGISLRYTMDKPIKEIDDGTTDGDGYKLGEGSKFTCKLDYTLKGAEFNRLAGLDYSKFDGEEGYLVFNRKVDMPDGTRQFRENKLEKVVGTFAEEFKVKAECRMDFTMTLRPTDEEQILQNSQLQGGNVIINP